MILPQAVTRRDERRHDQPDQTQAKKQGRPLHAVPSSSRWIHLMVVSITVYCLLTAAVTVVSIRLNNGHLVYALDDPYIHLSIARTWLHAHTLGISPYHFAPASSSPMWTVILTLCGYVFGLPDWLPYAFNVVCCVFLLWAFWWSCRELLRLTHADQAWRRTTAVSYAAAGALPIVAHLPGLTLAGMEHPLHAALTILFTATLFSCLTRTTHRDVVLLYVLALLLPLARLEGAFAVLVGILLLVLHRKFRHAILLACLGSLPTIALGLCYQHMGALFLSNSIVAKAVPSGGLLVARLALFIPYDIVQLAADPTVAAVVIFNAVWLFFSLRTGRKLEAQLGAYVLLICVLHLTFSAVGWFGRYQAYLIILGLLPPIVSLGQRSRTSNGAALARQSLFATAVLILVLFAAFNKAPLLLETPLATNNIYEQQYAIASFAHTYYRHATIVANDVGAISFRVDGSVVDLTGLGSTDVLKAIRSVGGQRQLTARQIEPILKRDGAGLIVIYPEWFSRNLYRSWIPVASWTLGKKRVTPAYSTVVFYAHNSAAYPTLRHRLHSFAPQLPRDVSVHYFGEPVVVRT